jgi:hypothetical protein
MENLKMPSVPVGVSDEAASNKWTPIICNFLKRQNEGVHFFQTASLFRLKIIVDLKR